MSRWTPPHRCPRSARRRQRVRRGSAPARSGAVRTDVVVASTGVLDQNQSAVLVPACAASLPRWSTRAVPDCRLACRDQACPPRSHHSTNLHECNEVRIKASASCSKAAPTFVGVAHPGQVPRPRVPNRSLGGRPHSCPRPTHSSRAPVRRSRPLSTAWLGRCDEAAGRPVRRARGSVLFSHRE